jgi:hypothetical protein
MMVKKKKKNQPDDDDEDLSTVVWSAGDSIISIVLMGCAFCWACSYFLSKSV